MTDLKQCAAVSENIHIWCHDVFIAKKSKIRPSQIVGDNQDDIWWPVWSSRDHGSINLSGICVLINPAKIEGVVTRTAYWLRFTRRQQKKCADTYRFEISHVFPLRFGLPKCRAFQWDREEVEAFKQPVRSQYRGAPVF